MSDPRPLEIRMFLPAVGGLEVAAAEAAAALADQAGAGEAVAGDVRLAVIEGCINAIEHAYREVPAGSAPPEVELRFRLEPADPSTGSTRSVLLSITSSGVPMPLAARSSDRGTRPGAAGLPRPTAPGCPPLA